MLLNHFITPTIIDGKQIKEKCSVEGCEHHSRNNGVCYQHGAIVDRCRVDGCDRQATKGEVCKMHQSMANLLPQKKYDCPRCSIDGCSHSAAGGGICRKHGEKKIFKRCSADGCDERAWIGGVSYRHQSMVYLPQKKYDRPRCSVDGCYNAWRKTNNMQEV